MLSGVFRIHCPRSVGSRIDLAKSVFQVHASDRDGKPVLRKKLRRGQVLAFFAGLSPCLVGLEACASAHHWARAIRDLGHEVRLIPPQYVRPFVKTNKTDASDAEAICEALVRPTMRFAAVKSAEQQSVLLLHRARELLVRQRTMLINALRGHCAEFGIVVAQGACKVSVLVAVIEDPEDERIPSLAREALGSLVAQLRGVQTEIGGLEKKLQAWHRSSEASRRLAAIPGVGFITATALVATIGDASQFPLRTPAGRLARARSETALQWRQGSARQDIQAWRRLSASPPGPWRPSGPALVEAQEAHALGMAREPARPPTGQRRPRRHGQQDRPGRLGDAHQG